VRLVWLVNLVKRTVAVFRSPSAPEILGEQDMVDGGSVSVAVQFGEQLLKASVKPGSRRT
jgi:hypothetical protein